jgi:hypothetical protein
VFLWSGGGQSWGQTIRTLVPLTNYTWRYNDSATDFGTTWRAKVYAPEGDWPSGSALFGVESSFPYPYPEPLRTRLVLNAGRTTYYFRTHFNYSGPTNGIQLLATAYVDDGAAFYLNGVEVSRVRLPQGPISFGTEAQLLLPEGPPDIVEFAVTNLWQGDNVLAVEVHQNSATSSDVVFGMMLQTYTLEVPQLTPETPADQMVPQGSPVSLSVTATGYPPPGYQWFKDGAPIPGATNPSYDIASVGPAEAGNYYVLATNRAGQATSRVARVSFMADTTPPTVLYAMALPNPAEMLVVFTEPVDRFIAEDNFSWMLAAVGTGTELVLNPGRMEQGTNLYLSLSEPRDATRGYQLTLIGSDLPDLFGNAMPLGTVIPIATFETLLIPDSESHPWRYEQSYTDLGTAWVAPGYADSTWLTGSSPFDVERELDGSIKCRQKFPATGDPIRTCVALSNATATAQLPTIYFRTHFTFNGEPANAVLHLRTIINDGAVFYLNGAELLRVGMPDGPIAYHTLASRLAGDSLTEEWNAAAPTLRSGDNLLAVELHQQRLDSRDFTLAAVVTAFLPTLPASRPQLAYSVSGGMLELNWAGGTLESASLLTGPWTPVSPSNPPNRHVLDPASGTIQFFRIAQP